MGRTINLIVFLAILLAGLWLIPAHGVLGAGLALSAAYAAGIAASWLPWARRLGGA